MVSIPVECSGCRGIASFRVRYSCGRSTDHGTSSGILIRRARKRRLELLPHETDDMSEPGSRRKNLRNEKSSSGWEFQEN
jgi:hypothetical protein